MGPTARQKGIDLRFSDAADTPATFRSDERLLHLVLKNLVENSLKFTPAGGSVHRWVYGARSTQTPRTLDGSFLLPPTPASGSHLNIAIVSSERIYQVDAARSGTAGRGTGLGLAIVKHAIAALGGTVKLESSVGRGTTVACAYCRRR